MKNKYKVKKQLDKARDECQKKLEALQYLEPMVFITDKEREILRDEIDNLENLLKNYERE